MADIKLVVNEAEEHIGINVDSEEEVGIKVQNVMEVITSDYQKLNNLPSINGTELFDNYNEIDPTVPEWAKGEEPGEMSFSDIKEIWDSVFN